MGHFLLVVSILAMIIAGETSELGALHVGIKVDPTLFAWLWMAANVVIVVVVTRIYTNAMRARHDVDYLSPYAFGTLSALADILLPPDARQMEPDDVARNVDAYLTDFTAEGKGKIKWALRGMTAYPLLTLRPPFGAMEREQRRAFMEKRFMSCGGFVVARSLVADPDLQADDGLRVPTVYPLGLNYSDRTSVPPLAATSPASRAARGPLPSWRRFPQTLPAWTSRSSTRASTLSRLTSSSSAAARRARSSPTRWPHGANR